MPSLNAQAAALSLSYTPDDTKADDVAAFKSIKDFLTADSSASAGETASSILATLPGPPSEEGSDEHWSVYNVFIDVAKQIPYDHPALVRLVRVIGELSRSPKTSITKQEEVCLHVGSLHKQPTTRGVPLTI